MEKDNREMPGFWVSNRGKFCVPALVLMGTGAVNWGYHIHICKCAANRTFTLHHSERVISPSDDSPCTVARPSAAERIVDFM